MGIKTLGAAVAGLALAVTATAAPAQAGQGWTKIERNAWFAALTWQPGALPGHEGNWHTVSVDYDGDDDGLTGGISDWQCPDDTTEPSYLVCDRLADWELTDVDGVTVRFTNNARWASLRGPATLVNAGDGTSDSVRVHVRLRSTGDLTRLVERSADDVLRYRVVTSTGADLVARGHVGPVRFGGGVATETADLQVRRTWTKPLT
ncbi:MAG: hypothetical protein U0R78_03155 [Nocardioidaceae bacterium]